MFSVIIPLYNKESQIKKTLDSVLRQSFTDFEVVIVNDGSKDGSVSIVESIKDRRIRLINQENRGVSAARNRGIIEAKHDWIAFLDADDLWVETKLESMASIIENNPSIQWLCSGYTSVKGKNRHDFTYNKEGVLRDALDDLDRGLRIQTSTVVVKREKFVEDKNLMFSVGINSSEDREVWYKLSFRFPLYYIKESLSQYVIDTEGNSLNTTPHKTFSFLELEKRLQNEIANLTPERQKKFKTFCDKFTKEGLVNYWIVFGWDQGYIPYFSTIEQYIMIALGSAPKTIKKLISKIML